MPGLTRQGDGVGCGGGALPSFAVFVGSKFRADGEEFVALCLVAVRVPVSVQITEPVLHNRQESSDDFRAPGTVFVHGRPMGDFVHLTYESREGEGVVFQTTILVVPTKLLQRLFRDASGAVESVGDHLGRREELVLAVLIVIPSGHIDVNHPFGTDHVGIGVLEVDVDTTGRLRLTFEVQTESERHLNQEGREFVPRGALKHHDGESAGLGVAGHFEAPASLGGATEKVVGNLVIRSVILERRTK